MKHLDAEQVDGDKRSLDLILNYIEKSDGLQVTFNPPGTVGIFQSADRKTVIIALSEIQEVLTREDLDQKTFLQVNFTSGKKILLTESYIGFKPAQIVGLETDKLPKVVTTPDLVSVFEALEEAMSVDAGAPEIETLKKVFQAIIQGGESIGFDLATEKEWIKYLVSQKATA